VHALEPPERKTNRHRSKPQPPALKKKKGVTRVAHAATLQLNPAMEGYSLYEKGNHQDKPPALASPQYNMTAGIKKKKGLHGSLKQLRCNETQPR
jgi:hypothetical protein